MPGLASASLPPAIAGTPSRVCAVGGKGHGVARGLRAADADGHKALSDHRHAVIARRAPEYGLVLDKPHVLALGDCRARALRHQVQITVTTDNYAIRNKFRLGSYLRMVFPDVP